MKMSILLLFFVCVTNAAMVTYVTPHLINSEGFYLLSTNTIFSTNALGIDFPETSRYLMLRCTHEEERDISTLFLEAKAVYPLPWRFHCRPECLRLQITIALNTRPLWQKKTSVWCEDQVLAMVFLITKGKRMNAQHLSTKISKRTDNKSEVEKLKQSTTFMANVQEIIQIKRNLSVNAV